MSYYTKLDHHFLNIALNLNYKNKIHSLIVVYYSGPDKSIPKFQFAAYYHIFNDNISRFCSRNLRDGICVQTGSFKNYKIYETKNIAKAVRNLFNSQDKVFKKFVIDNISMLEKEAIAITDRRKIENEVLGQIKTSPDGLDIEGFTNDELDKILASYKAVELINQIKNCQAQITQTEKLIAKKKHQLNNYIFT